MNLIPEAGVLPLRHDHCGTPLPRTWGNPDRGTAYNFATMSGTSPLRVKSPWSFLETSERAQAVCSHWTDPAPASLSVALEARRWRYVDQRTASNEVPNESTS
ncbi:hypothetical protein OH77DRAFT_152792 [Trametes cingulata]|nr:hypothetical protein OH77DRAFT_152792 [Trametes cingulata]